MAYELKPWKQTDRTLSVSIEHLSSREPFSREINEMHGEGGALNANYRTVEAIAFAANKFGLRGLVYGVHFVFKTANLDHIVFDFCDEHAKKRAMSTLVPGSGEED